MKKKKKTLHLSHTSILNRLICRTLQVSTMFGLIATAFEMSFMVLEPAYRTYKVLKSSKGMNTKLENNGEAVNRPAIWVSSRNGNETEEVPDGGPDKDKDKDTDQRHLLLMHWIVYAAFQATEWITKPVLPFYPVISIVTVVWLRTGGTEVVYRNLVEPFLFEHEQAIDKILNKFDQAKGTVINVTDGLQQANAAAAAAAAETDDETDVGRTGGRQPLQAPVVNLTAR